MTNYAQLVKIMRCSVHALFGLLNSVPACTHLSPEPKSASNFLRRVGRVLFQSPVLVSRYAVRSVACAPFRQHAPVGPSFFGSPNPRAYRVAGQRTSAPPTRVGASFRQRVEIRSASLSTGRATLPLYLSSIWLGSGTRARSITHVYGCL